MLYEKAEWIDHEAQLVCWPRFHPFRPSHHIGHCASESNAACPTPSTHLGNAGDGFNAEEICMDGLSWVREKNWLIGISVVRGSQRLSLHALIS